MSLSIYRGQRPTTREQMERNRPRESHDAVGPETTRSERRGGGGDGAGGISATEVLELAKYEEEAWGVTHGEMEIDHIIFSLSQEINVPEGYNRVRPSTGYSIVATFADHVAGDMPVVKVPEANLTKVAEKRSEKIEKFLQASYHRFLGRESTNHIRTMAMNFGWAGMAVSQGPLFVADEWGPEPEEDAYDTSAEYDEALGEYEAAKRARWPFYWRFVDPRHAYPDSGTIGKQYVLVQYERSVASIMAQWPEWEGQRPNTREKYPPNHKLHWVEYWDGSHRIYLAGGEELDASKHRYSKPPFQIRSGGFGEDSGELHERFRSLLYPARSMINQQIRAWCQFDAIMRQAAWTTMLTPEGSNFKSIKPGEVVPMKREDIEFTRPLTEIRGEVVQALLAEIDAIGEQIEEATYPQVVRGVRAKGVGSGYGQNSLAALGKIKFGAAGVAAQSLLQEWNEDYLYCIEHVVEETVPVWGPTQKGFVDFSLGPQDIKGYYYNIVTLNPKLPIDRANEIQIGSVLYNNGMGVIDAATYLSDFAGYEQPDELRIKVLRDQTLQMPAVKQIMVLAALEETGMLDFLTKTAQKMGMDPMLVMQSLGLLGPTPAPVLPPGAPGGASSLTGAQMNAGPSAQAEPVPGAINASAPMTPTAAAQGAGVPPPGA